MTMSSNYVIVGASAAGIAAAIKIRQKDASARIVCLTQENSAPYNKCFLVDWVSGNKTWDELFLREPSFFTEHGIELVYNCSVQYLDLQKRMVTCNNGSQWQYKKLLLAMGASARTLSALHDKKNVYTFYTMQDVQKIITLLEQQDSKKRIAVIGAGITGMECVDALLAHKNNIASLCVIDTASQVLGRLITSDGSDFLEYHMQKHDIIFYKNSSISFKSDYFNCINRVYLSDGTCVPVDIVITVVGSIPNTQWLKNSGLVLDTQALVVNEWLQTSDSDVYAAGDCIVVKEQLSGSSMRSCMWADAMAQGMVAGSNMVYHEKQYNGIVLQTVSHLFGMPFSVMGRLYTKNENERLEIIQASDYYARIVYSNDGVVQGYCVIGTVPDRSVSKLRRSLLTKVYF